MNIHNDGLVFQNISRPDSVCRNSLTEEKCNKIENSLEEGQNGFRPKSLTLSSKESKLSVNI